MCWSSGTASSPMRRALCLSRLLNLVCKIPLLLFGLSKTNTIGYYARRKSHGLRPEQIIAVQSANGHRAIGAFFAFLALLSHPCAQKALLRGKSLNLGVFLCKWGYGGGHPATVVDLGPRIRWHG